MEIAELKAKVDSIMNLVGGYDGLAKRLIDIVHLKKTRVTQSDF